MFFSNQLGDVVLGSRRSVVFVAIHFSPIFHRATVPIGYADGYRRSLSGRFYVLIHGQRAPILGRVCMDQMMVDVTDIPGVQAGDTVTLIGTDGDETISMEEIAAAAGSFNYEFACGISRRVPRVYLRGGQAVHTVHYLTDVYHTISR
ncbi:alanine racemase domain-containing protein [Firmicutes bacterium CAG:110]|nr:alanine racemase domain-containing protein [Firmicutes bacterium CAG:110]